MPDTQEAVRTFLFAARARLTRAQDVVLRHTRSDAVCIAIVLLLAILTRLPLLAHPDVTKFDEVIYADYASALVDGKPFF
jgi:dolichyl-phosphate-mannose--protein O-mannosyl transferase